MVTKIDSIQCFSRTISSTTRRIPHRIGNVATARAWLACGLAMVAAIACDEPTHGIVDGGAEEGTDDGGVIFTPSECAPTFGGVDEPVYKWKDNAFEIQPVLDTEPAREVHFMGRIFGGPNIVFHKEKARSGTCRLLTYTPSSCTPPCSGGDVCIDGECRSYPTTLSAGTLHIDVGTGEIASAEPSTYNDQFDYFWMDTDRTLAPGAAVRVSADGADVPAFSLETCYGGAPTPADDWDALFENRSPGEDVTITWSDPVAGARIYLLMETCMGGHGYIDPVNIECEGPDKGALTIPGDFLDELYADLENWSHGNCGRNFVWRYQAAETTVGGITVQLRAQNMHEFYFRVGDPGW